MTRTKRIGIALGLFASAAAAWFCVTAAYARDVDVAGEFRRGIGVSHAMAWARIEPGPAGKFAFPPFSDPWNTLTLDQLGTLRRAGFDFVRFAVDPGPFLQFQGIARDQLDHILVDRITLILQSGLSVVVAIFPSDLHPDYTAKALTAGLHTPLFQDYLQLIERTARLLDRFHTGKIALELMNEPPVAPRAWQPMLEAAYAAARRAADLPLVLDGGDEASAAALLAMKTDAFAKDRAAFLTFHYYDPYQFTHQGAPWNDARYLTDVPYPAFARPLQESLDATGARLETADLSQAQKSAAYSLSQTQLESYRRSAFDGDTIAKTFAQVAAWARSQDVPPDRVLLGEFGVRKTEFQFPGAREAERAQWFHDVRAAAAAEGFGWSAWTFRGAGGFGLTRSETSNDLEPAIAAALGLNFSPQRKAASPR
jgi:hypothetical protein